MGIKDFDWQNKHWIAPLKYAVLLDLALLSFIPKPYQLYSVEYRKGCIHCHVIIGSSLTPDPPISAVLDVLHHQHAEVLGMVWRLLHGFVFSRGICIEPMGCKLSCDTAITNRRHACERIC